MAAGKGNTYWKLAKGFGVGKERSYLPDQLWNKALDYAQWIEDNPLKEEKVFGTGVSMTINKMRAMTIKGFCIYANISSATFDNYSKNEAYIEITTRIRDLFFTQKFEGAAAELFNPNIIAREIGLADKQEIEDNRSLVINVTDNKTKNGLDKLKDTLSSKNKK